ncbi:hypothetical protein AAHC03_020823 [Spirometra sp. Aus1]
MRVSFHSHILSSGRETEEHVGLERRLQETFIVAAAAGRSVTENTLHANSLFSDPRRFNRICLLHRKGINSVSPFKAI